MLNWSWHLLTQNKCKKQNYEQKASASAIPKKMAFDMVTCFTRLVCTGKCQTIWQILQISSSSSQLPQTNISFNKTKLKCTVQYESYGKQKEAVVLYSSLVIPQWLLNRIEVSMVNLWKSDSHQKKCFHIAVQLYNKFYNITCTIRNQQAASI